MAGKAKPRAPRSAPRTAPGPAPAIDIEAFVRELGHAREREILALRRIILAADPCIGEGIKWNAPSFHVGEHFATFHLRSPDHVQLILHLGAKPRPGAAVRSIDEPTAGLVWKSDDRAILTFVDLADVEARKAALTRVVRAWIPHVA